MGESDTLKPHHRSALLFSSILSLNTSSGKQTFSFCNGHTFSSHFGKQVENIYIKMRLMADEEKCRVFVPYLSTYYILIFPHTTIPPKKNKEQARVYSQLQSATIYKVCMNIVIFSNIKSSYLRNLSFSISYHHCLLKKMTSHAFHTAS